MELLALLQTITHFTILAWVLCLKAGALGDYALKRLRPRCHALLEVLLAENCSSLLEGVLNRFEVAQTEGRALRIASLGGGPGFDAIALLAAVDALQKAKLKEPGWEIALSLSENIWSNSTSLCPVHCKVLDLAPAWSPALLALSEAAFETWNFQPAELIELVAPIDIRESSPQILEAVSNADLVIASYVLHENEAALLKNDLLGGAIPDVFRSVPVGAPLIFLDATHRLWPVLVHTANIVSQESQRDFAVFVPQGLGSHIHAVALIRTDGVAETTAEAQDKFDIFSAHQRANEARLKRLSSLDSSEVEKGSKPYEHTHTLSVLMSKDREHNHAGLFFFQWSHFLDPEFKHQDFQGSSF